MEVIMTHEQSRNGVYKSSIRVWTITEFFSHQFPTGWRDKDIYDMPHAYHCEVDSDQAPNLITKKYLIEKFDHYSDTKVYQSIMKMKRRR